MVDLHARNTRVMLQFPQPVLYLTLSLASKALTCLLSMAVVSSR